jgi:hypothetical protein
VGEVRRLIAPGGPAHPLANGVPCGIVEDEEVDLVRVLVLDDAPGEAAGVDERRIQPDVAGCGVGVLGVADVDGDAAAYDPPVEGARVERGAHLRLLARRAAFEDVVAARGERGGRQEKEGNCRKRCESTKHLVKWSACTARSRILVLQPRAAGSAPPASPVSGRGYAMFRQAAAAPRTDQ